MPPNRDDFEIAIICALPLEARAAKMIIQAGNEDPGRADGDTNIYTTGKVGVHDVVLVHMPSMGKVPAAAASVGLKQSFKNIKLALLIGICGGVPTPEGENITLGDVIIGKQVVHYDFGREHENGFEMKDSPGSGRQSTEIRSFVAKLESQKKALESSASAALGSLWSPENMKDLHDGLYASDYWHIHQDPARCDGVGEKCRNGRSICVAALTSSCEELECDHREFVRLTEPKPRPNMHFGAVASGDKVMRSAKLRDSIAKKEEVIAFDMEAAGLWDYLPSILIKGVCDYADSHKNKRWQEYAAVTAAAYAKAVLEQWSPKQQAADQAAGKQQMRTQFFNNNSKIGNQAEQMSFYGNQTFSF